MVPRVNSGASHVGVGIAPVESRIRAFHEYLRVRSERGTQIPSQGKRLIQAIGEDLATVSSSEMPVDPVRIAVTLNACVEVAPTTSRGQLGKLVPVPGGFRVVLYGQERGLGEAQGSLGIQGDATPQLTNRGRFTLAHELGHALFYTRPRDAAEKPVRVIPAGSARDVYWREEGLCHEFARALLVPSFAKALVGPTPSPSAIVGATKALRVSREVLVRRVLHDWLLWSETTLLHVSGSGKQLRAQLLHGAAVSRRTVAVGAAQRLRAVEEEGDWLEVLNAIENLFGCPRTSMLVSEKEVWAIIQQPAPLK